MISIQMYFSDIFYVFFKGVFDSLTLYYPLHLTASSSRIRNLLVVSFICNVIVYLVNIYYLIYVAQWFPDVWNWFKIVFAIMWEIPIYAMLVYYNRKWTSQMTQLVCKKRYGDSKSKQPYLEMLYGVFLIYIFQGLLLFLSSALSWEIPRKTVLFFGRSWIASFCLFEPRLIYKGYSLQQRIHFLHRRWLYFLGYGAIWAIGHAWLNYRIWYPSFLFLAGFVSINTIHITPQKSQLLESVPVFSVINNLAEKIIESVLGHS
jgi:hypothetical protein